MTVKRRVWPVIVATACGIAVLLALGTWQLQRLHWKEALISNVVARLSAEPVSLESAMASFSAGQSVEYLKTTVRGAFRHEAEAHMIVAHDGGPGWEIITPLVTEDGYYILVDRGIAPEAELALINRPASQVDLLGVLLAHQSGRATFDPDNNPAQGKWYWWDVPAMLQASNPPSALKPVPFVLHVMPQLQDQGWPNAVLPASRLTNNHLQYALTWFSLAAVLLVIASLYIRGRMKNPPLEASCLLPSKRGEEGDPTRKRWGR